ncbi:hypothetical protein MTAT_03950 [Moorella thermoacetica]|uniref:Indolepyruvate oxidoreductase subunit beta n=1 Tax=Neomoorella thermoacetica TaxID=1525 RepID=A0AAC9HKI2_NEOTH|nr:indolepyruvate oxidoreductase subunit beta [Moorella thermoacetica]AOQ24801.1 indolepyruvate oxidoreductase subunit beta [Moorella thermoacetica]TYL15661.1 hypothetical protein MTAT_03950 [Moorella thermoacetica]
MVNSGTKSIMIVGVGGQGIILACRILTSGLIKSGYDVKSSEVHGMAQRGGSVVTQLCYGQKVYSPLVGEGAVDVLMALEKLEALRYVHFLKRKGLLLVNDLEIPSLPVITGKATYPEGIPERLKSFDLTLYSIPAASVARELGNNRVMNIIMLGAMIALTGLEQLISWVDIVREAVRPQYQDLNQRAFEMGLRTGKDLA